MRLDRLLLVEEATVKLPLGGFYFREISCGTIGCMIGNYNCLVGRDYIKYGIGNHDHLHFEITEFEYNWLFNNITWRVGQTYDFDLKTNWLHAPNVTQQMALDRLRKFIDYKLRKSMVSLECQRRGNFNFVLITTGGVA